MNSHTCVCNSMSQWVKERTHSTYLLRNQETYVSHHHFWTMLNFNSLAPGNFEWNFRHVIFKQILVIDGWGISCEIALIWMSLDFTDDQSTLVQVMAWCRQATSHYLSQCWPRSLSPYGITRPQWVNWVVTISVWSGHLYQAPHFNNRQQSKHI